MAYAKRNTVPIEASNIANLGTDLEKKIKAAAAQCEHAWDGAGSKGGTLEIWRIEKFQVVRWPDEQLGKFYNGDSYIILHTWKKNARSNELRWDVHFWLGQNTSQDEAGTAAYKTVELDDRLGGAAVQHREVQGHESPLFLSYFENNTIEILEGGIDSGFKHVEAKQYKPRLLQVKGNRKAVRVSQVPLSATSLNSGDVFILDLGLEIFQWNGAKSSSYEKVKAGQVVRAMRDERGGKPNCTLHNEGDSDLADFWKALGGQKPIAPPDNADDEAAKTALAERKLFRLEATGGKFNYTPIKTGELDKKDLETNHVYIVDSGAEIFVWVGKKSSPQDKRNGLDFAQHYITDNGKDPYLPISKVMEGGENQVFESMFSSQISCRGIGDDIESVEGFPHSCCPHHPGGGKYAFANQQKGAVAALAGAAFGDTSSSSNRESVSKDKAVEEVFGFFANKAASKLAHLF